MGEADGKVLENERCIYTLFTKFLVLNLIRVIRVNKRDLLQGRVDAFRFLH